MLHSAMCGIIPSTSHNTYNYYKATQQAGRRPSIDPFRKITFLDSFVLKLGFGVRICVGLISQCITDIFRAFLRNDLTWSPARMPLPDHCQSVFAFVTTHTDTYV